VSHDPDVAGLIDLDLAWHSKVCLYYQR
jgi:hypothetical protein